MVKWFFDNYIAELAQRREVYVSPLQASTEQLKGLPPAYIHVAGNDVLRDEGVAYARKLDAAGVEVTLVSYDGMIHDFGCLNYLSRIPAVRTACTKRRGIKKIPQISSGSPEATIWVSRMRAQGNSSVTPAHTRGRYREVSPTVCSRPGNVYWVLSQLISVSELFMTEQTSQP
jgi:acetyl esterase/lipase